MGERTGCKQEPLLSSENARKWPAASQQPKCLQNGRRVYYRLHVLLPWPAARGADARHRQESQRGARSHSALALHRQEPQRTQTSSSRKTRSMTHSALALHRQESRICRTPVAEAGLTAHAHRIGWTRSGSRQKLTEAAPHTIPDLRESPEQDLRQAGTIGANCQ